MYKNIEVLDKEKYKSIKFSEVDFAEVGKHIGLIPVGFTEVWYMSHSCPVIISAGENGEFLAFTGITKDISVFYKDDVYLPAFVRSYPFLNIDITDKNGVPNSIIGIDKNPSIVAKNKKNPIFMKDKTVSKEAQAKIDLVRELNRQRTVSKKIVAELKKYDLLIKQELRVKTGEAERVLIEEFYTINIEKLIGLEDAILATWARKGWMGIFDAHLKSLANFQRVLGANR